MQFSYEKWSSPLDANATRKCLYCSLRPPSLKIVLSLWSHYLLCIIIWFVIKNRHFLNRRARSTIKQVFFSSPVLNLRLKVFTKLYDSSFKFPASQARYVHIPLRQPPVRASKSFVNVKVRSTPLFAKKIGISEQNEWALTILYHISTDLAAKLVWKMKKKTRHAVLKEHNACWRRFCLGGGGYLTFYPLWHLSDQDVFTPVCANAYVLMHMLKSRVSVWVTWISYVT